MPKTSRRARTTAPAQQADELQLELNQLTRRRLFQAGGAAAAVAMVYASPLAKVAMAAAGSDVPNYLVRSSYLDLTDKVFSVDGRQLVLKEVADFMVAGIQPNLAENEDGFSLLFSGPPADQLGSGIKTLNNSEIGSFDIYLGAVNQGSAQEYEVIVNRVLNRKDRRVRPPKPAAPAASAPNGSAQPGQTKRGPTRAFAKSPVRNITAKRTEHGIKVVAQLKPKSRVRTVTGWVSRDGRPVGAASRKVHSDTRLAFNVKTAARVRRGHYDVHLQTIDRRGVEAFRIARVKLDD